MTEALEIVVGLDVSNAVLDVNAVPLTQAWRFPNVSDPLTAFWLRRCP